MTALAARARRRAATTPACHPSGFRPSGLNTAATFAGICHPRSQPDSSQMAACGSSRNGARRTVAPPKKLVWSPPRLGLRLRRVRGHISHRQSRDTTAVITAAQMTEGIVTMVIDKRAQAIELLLQHLREVDAEHNDRSIDWRREFGSALSEFAITGPYERTPRKLLDALQDEFKIDKDEGRKLRDDFDRSAAESAMAASMASDETTEPVRVAEDEEAESAPFETVDPKRFQVMPDLMPEAYERLENAIREEGMHTPVIVDEDGAIIDGHNRAAIAATLNIDYPRQVVSGKSESEKLSLAFSLNSNRRHLTREQKRKLVAKSLRAEPELSDRQHARRAGVDHKTARSVRTDLVSRGEIPLTEQHVDSSGRIQPASKPAVDPAAKAETDYEAMESNAQTDCPTAPESPSLSERHTPKPGDNQSSGEFTRQPIEHESSPRMDPNARVKSHLQSMEFGGQGVLSALDACVELVVADALERVNEVRSLLDRIETTISSRWQ